MLYIISNILFIIYIYIIYKIYTILYIQNYIVEEVKNYSMNLLKNNQVISRFVRSSDDNQFYIKLYKHLTNLWKICCTELY